MSEVEAAVLGTSIGAVCETIRLLNMDCQPVSIAKYYPRTIEDFEVQLFNISATIPFRFKSPDQIGMWILENELLDRKQVTAFLANRSELSLGVLMFLSQKICSIEAGYGFMEGMKLFLPVVGCTDFSTDENLLRYMLQAYCKGHLRCSKSPVLTGLENLTILVDIAMSVWDLNKIMVEGKKPQAIAMSDFFGILRNILRKGSNLSMSIKVMTDMFNATATGRPITALTIPPGTASYLFANVKVSGEICLSFDELPQYDDSTYYYYGRISADSLYLFESSERPRSNSLLRSSSMTAASTQQLVGCIPLYGLYVNEQYIENFHEYTNSSNSGVIELISNSHKPIPFLVYLPTVQVNNNSSSGSSNSRALGGVFTTIEWPAPVSVQYYTKIFLKILSKEEDSSNATNAWFDGLETASWESKSKNRN